MSEKTFDFYQGLIKEMVDDDRNRDKLFQGVDDMFYNRYELPQEIRNLQWIHKVVSTDPHDALNTATRVLSTIRPKLTFQPLAPGAANKGKADLIERALEWHLAAASRRPRARIVRDMVQSALRYDEIAAQVVYIPWQQKAMGRVNDRRLTAMGRMGPFAVVVHNPRHVHTRYSDYMLEAVVLTKVMKAKEVLDFWGDRARELQRVLQEENEALTYVSYFDYMDFEKRVVFAIPQESPTSLGDAKTGTIVKIIDREVHELPFLPWVERVGGTALESESEYMRKPLLESVWRSGQWETLNIVNSLEVGEGIAYAAAPRGKKQSITREAADDIPVDYGQPGRDVLLGQGEDYTPLPPPQLDRALAEIADRTAAAIGKSTVARFLANLDFPSGVAFATVNAVIQAATSSLSPYQELAEFAIADICVRMLEWVEHTGDPLLAFDDRKGSRGEQMIVRSGDYDVDNLHISARLTAHVPTDFIQRINAATLMVERLGYPKARAYEDLNVTDPEQVMEEAQLEALDANELQLRLQQRQMEVQMEMAQLMQMQQQLAQQMAAPNGAGNAFDAAQGPGFNPAEGGAPPAEAAPFLTREQVRGVDREGTPVIPPGEF